MKVEHTVQIESLPKHMFEVGDVYLPGERMYNDLHNRTLKI